jgi:Mn2+/Fe2+ NRAMP family transporter
MKTYRQISYVAFAIAVALFVIALMLLTGSYTRMQNVAVVLLIGFGVCATIGMFFAAKAEGIDSHGHQRQVPPDAHAGK